MTSYQPPERIETKRLVLRIPRLSDVRTIFDTYTHDPEVTRYLMWRPHTHIDETQQFLVGCLDAWENGKRFPYVITLKGADDAIGMIDFHIHGSTVGLGYMIARPHWGRGYTPEAVQAVIEWAFSQPLIYRVNATCDVENVASARVMEKAGMQREGLLRRYVLHPNISDEPRDCYIYAIVK